MRWLDGGLTLPLPSVTVTLTEYCVPGVRAVKEQRGEALVQMTLLLPLPPKRFAVKV